MNNQHSQVLYNSPGREQVMVITRPLRIERASVHLVTTDYMYLLTTTMTSLLSFPVTRSKLTCHLMLYFRQTAG